MAFSRESGDFIGGYDYEWVDDDLADEYVCPICTLVARSPQQANCCGHVFCEGCLQKLRLTNCGFKCPVCREALESNCFFDKRADRKIKYLRVYCKNKNSDSDADGCLWVGELNEIENHLEKACLYQFIQCTNKCGLQDIKRMNLQHHLANDCIKRQVTCQYCDEEGFYDVIIGVHLEECLKFPIECTNEGCYQQIPRFEIPLHKTSCPKEVICCQYNSVGCNERIKREDQVMHNENSTEHHLHLAVKEIIDLRKSKDFLKMKVEGLERDNQKRIKMHTEFLALKEKFEKFQNEVESQVGDLQGNISKLQTNLKSSQSSVADLLKSQAITKQNVEEILEKRYSEHSSLIKFSEFEKSRKDNVSWYSPGFYSSPAGGYKMCLNVIPNGYGDSEGTHVSCFIYLMRGDNDDSLEWPFQATVKIELLNQLKDQNHHGVVLTFDNSTSPDFKSRVIEQERSKNGLGNKKFFELSSLKDVPEYMYLNDDTLYFRVSVQSCCKFKDWLV